MRYVLISIASFLLVSCSLFTTEDVATNVARVNNHYLTKNALEQAIENNVVTDTSAFVQHFINNWATEQLLFDGALRNVPEDEQAQFDALVGKYKRDLYTKYYADVLLSTQLDSIVDDKEAAIFYKENKNNFKLNEPLVQFKFIAVDEDYNIKDLKNYFSGTTIEDKNVIDSLKFQYKNYFLNDSTWIKRSTVIQQVLPINSDNAERLLKKTNLLQLRDSLGLYLIAVKNTLDRNDIAPLQYVRPTINQILLNKRKLALIKKLEKEIKDDAIKNKEFEIYD